MTYATADWSKHAIENFLHFTDPIEREKKRAKTLRTYSGFQMQVPQLQYQRYSWRCAKKFRRTRPRQRAPEDGVCFKSKQFIPLPGATFEGPDPALDFSFVFFNSSPHPPLPSRRHTMWVLREFPKFRDRNKRPGTFLPYL